MQRRPPPGGARRRWQRAVLERVDGETPTAASFWFRLPPGAERHVPGQHYDLRLTAPDGSTAQRSYSIASAPAAPEVPGSGPLVALTVERLADGEVSPYLHDEVRVGDDVELRGPFGGWFIWRGDGPVLLIGGGSGVVPLMSMHRYWRASGRSVALRLVVSVRTPDDLYFAEEYGAETDLVYTREAPPDAARGPGRLDLDTVAPALRALTDEPPSGAVAGARALTTSSPSAGITGYVCGSAGFAEHASQLLVTAGLPRDAVRVERFGPS